MNLNRKQSAKEGRRRLPLWLVGLFALYLLSGLRASRFHSSFDIKGFAGLPVLDGGRVKPLDTVARASLLMLRGKQTLRVNGQSQSAAEWLLDVLFRPALADAAPVFEIDDPDVLGLLGMVQTRNRYYSFINLQPYLTDIDRQADRARAAKPEQRTRFQTAILNLQSRLALYQKLENTLQVAGEDNVSETIRDFENRLTRALIPPHIGHSFETLAKDLERYQFLTQVAEFYPLPLAAIPGHPNKWVGMGEGILHRLPKETVHPGVAAYAVMGDAYRRRDPEAFHRALDNYGLWLNEHARRDVSMARYEVLFNTFEPFYKSLVIYLAVFLLAFTSWLVWPQVLNRSALALMILAFVVHTAGLVSRMAIQGRPPVTNLYSSAIFVGWAAVLLGIFLERLFRNGIGSAVASAIGFLTLIIAHHLAAQGDTLEMMRAVLDSNFWLATHVVCITLGYSASFLSGFIATVYLIQRAFARRWNAQAGQALERMVYGVVCFSAFFSFLGTVLGGIWADQSWGRFWGWDPKENGALLIVLWNVFILHARQGGFAQPRSVMLMAVFGNIVTALSWFGVNMLGIGLHSYGFMDKAFVWLMLFVISQLAVMGIGLLPDPAYRGSIPSAPR